jgi:SAM-dependent methyltransferase
MPDTFRWQGVDLPYLDAPYNDAGRNERTIEVPVALHYLRQFAPGDVLEVGNVCNHYLPAPYGHLVVDRDEPGPDVINTDFLFWQARRQFALIVSISTLEHMADAQRAFLRLAHHRAPGGTLLVSLPFQGKDGVGNCDRRVDTWLAARSFQAAQWARYDRHAERADWREVTDPTVPPLIYSTRWWWAETVYFLGQRWEVVHA